MTEKHCIYFTRFFSGTRGSTCSGLSNIYNTSISKSYI